LAWQVFLKDKDPVGSRRYTILDSAPDEEGNSMMFRVRAENRPTTTGLDGTVFILEEDAGHARAEIWPANGCNCFHWQIDRGTLDLLYADPGFFEGSKPTRSGIPILLPFPNRIRDGRFAWENRRYQLPLNDPSGKNAIHGFAFHRPWRVLERGADKDAAWLTAEFHGSVDAPEARPLWPADYRARVTFRLEARALRIHAVVDNPDRVPLPFGLGYHPYFKLPALAGDRAEDCLAQITADEVWELRESLPTGKRLPVVGGLDLRNPRRVAELHLDDVWHCPGASIDPQAGEVARASVFRPWRSAEVLRVETEAAFRELVGFTPPHRQAICFEPYTCTTDAINLEQQGVDAGLRVLEPGEQWQGDVKLLAMPG
jgi:aldose 1-epimerase